MSARLWPLRLLCTAALLSAALPQAHQVRSDWTMQEKEYVLAYVNVTLREPAGPEPPRGTSEVGKYGTGLVGMAAGRLVHARSRNGTSRHGCDFPWESAPAAEPWIALVRHGRCHPNAKLENAFRSNASGLVVYGNQVGGRLLRLQLTSRHRDSIVTVFIRKEHGDRLAELLERGLDLYMQLSQGKHFTVSITNINKTSVLFVSVSFILLMIVSLAWLLFYYVQRFRYMHAKDRLARRLVWAARKALSRIPVATLKSGDDQLNDGDCCAVCLEAYRPTEHLRTLPCSHEFHKLCVDPWLLKNRTCPMCKMDILKYSGLAVTEEGVMRLDRPAESSILESEPSSSSPQHSSLGPHMVCGAPAGGACVGAPASWAGESGGSCSTSPLPVYCRQPGGDPAHYWSARAAQHGSPSPSFCGGSLAGHGDDVSLDDSDSFQSCHLSAPADGASSLSQSERCVTSPSHSGRCASSPSHSEWCVTSLSQSERCVTCPGRPGRRATSGAVVVHVSGDEVPHD